MVSMEKKKSDKSTYITDLFTINFKAINIYKSSGITGLTSTSERRDVYPTNQ